MRWNMVQSVEIHADAIAPSEQVLLMDDLIATGGMAETATAPIQKLGGVVMGCAFLIDLPDLGCSKRLVEAGFKPFSLCQFEG